RDVVVRDLEVVRGGPTARLLLRRAATTAAAAGTAPTRPAALAAAAQQDQARLGPAHPDLGGVPLVAVLVRPLVVVDGALEVHLLALRAVVADDLRGLAEDLDAMPLRALLLLAVFARPALGRGEGEVGDGLTALGVPDLGIPAEVADQDHAVDAGHVSAFLTGVEFLARLAAGFRVREALGHEPVLEQGLAAPAQPFEGHALLEARVGDLVARRVLAEQLVPGLDRLRVLLLRVLAFADPVLRVVAEVGVGVVAQVVRVLLDGEVVVAAGVVGIGLGVELTRSGGLRVRHDRGGGRLGARRDGRGRGPARGDGRNPRRRVGHDRRGSGGGPRLHALAHVRDAVVDVLEGGGYRLLLHPPVRDQAPRGRALLGQRFV